MNEVQEQINMRKAREHKLESVNLLAFIVVLFLVILTIWFLRKKRITFVHESGLAIIYGVTLGAIIKFLLSSSSAQWINLSPTNQTITDLKQLPEFVYLNYVNVNESFVYKYFDVSIGDFNEAGDFEKKATFNVETFFNILLPPIIFQAGYSMKKRHFFRNFGAILLFAFIGTTISSFCIGGLLYALVLQFESIKTYFRFVDCLLFGTIISATDPVTTLAIFNEKNLDSDLYALIFGESVLNDAISIILSEQVEKFGNSDKIKNFHAGQVFEALGTFLGIFLGSVVFGIIIGCLNALFTKLTSIREHPGLETASFILISYSTFLASEALGFSGIVALLICGIMQAHYTYNNLSHESQVQTKEIIHLMSFLSENFIFIYIGISLFTFKNHNWEPGFIGSSLLAILVARVLNIYPLSYLINLTRSKSNKIKFNMQNFMLFSGLRGALAFALAIRNTSNKSRQLILTTTLVIVIITVIFCGGLTSIVANLLKIQTAAEKEISRSKVVNDPKSRRSRFKKFLSNLVIFKSLRSFDKRFIKPLLTNLTPSLMETMSPKLRPFARIFTSKLQTDAEAQSIITSQENPLVDDSEPNNSLDDQKLEIIE